MAKSTRRTRKADYYTILDVPQTATPDEIRNAFRQLAEKYHPDLYHENIKRLWACRKMQEINTAYEILSNPVKRKSYDAVNKHTLSEPIQKTGTVSPSAPSDNKPTSKKTGLTDSWVLP